MPELMTEYFYACDPQDFQVRMLSKSKPGETYLVELIGPAEMAVRFPQHQDHCYQQNLVCSCPGFKFRGTCSHTEKVRRELYCGWYQFIDGGEPKEVNGKKVCPRCGSPVTVIKEGV